MVQSQPKTHGLQSVGFQRRHCVVARQGHHCTLPLAPKFCYALPSQDNALLNPAIATTIAHSMANLPLGKTGKFQKANLLASFKGELFKVGWIRFASDGGMYAQFHYKAPITCVGEAIQASGLLQARTREDLTHCPLDMRSNVHLSLHPSGKIHVRSNRQKPIIELDFGQWLPVSKPCLLGYFFSPAVGTLDRQEKPKFQDRVFSVARPEDGIRATITVLPKDFHPTQPALMGVSPRYNIGVTIAAVSPPTPSIYFAKCVKSLDASEYILKTDGITD